MIRGGAAGEPDGIVARASSTTFPRRPTIATRFPSGDRESRWKSLPAEVCNVTGSPNATTAPSIGSVLKRAVGLVTAWLVGPVMVVVIGQRNTRSGVARKRASPLG